MGRLFWKIFVAFWLTLMAIAVGVGVVVHLYNQARIESMTELAAGPRVEINVAATAAALHYGGRQAVENLFSDLRLPRRPVVLIVDAEGHDIFDRPVPRLALERARAELGDERHARGVRLETAPGGRDYVLFVPAVEGPPVPHPRHRHGLPPTERLIAQLAMALAAGLAFSAGLAWYLTGPLRHLREASRRLADGQLDARVMPAIGRRRDEIADLGRDFDHMAERLQALVGAHKRLLHDVSHELRSPLARLQVAVGLARQQPDKAAAALDRIERESGRLDELVGEVLTLSRLEAGVSEPSEDYVDLADLLAEVAQDAGFEAAANERKLSVHTEGGAVVRGRAELLRRAFENVIRNAIKYTPPGTTVEAALMREPGAQQARVSVCDRGPGVLEPELGQVFEPFYQVPEGGIGGGRGGYGLGLAIAKRAIEAHAGTIQARNRADGGLCVDIVLPCVESPPAE
jgi:two-component system OmpR family sensor kinase